MRIINNETVLSRDEAKRVEECFKDTAANSMGVCRWSTLPCPRTIETGLCAVINSMKQEQENERR